MLEYILVAIIVILAAWNVSILIYNKKVSIGKKGYMLDFYTDLKEIDKKGIDELLNQMVMALSEAVDAKDHYTSGHSYRVASYARKIAECMGKSEEEQDSIYRAGLLHDVGKIRIHEEILNKSGKLTDEEYEIIKLHTITGFYILRGISKRQMFADASRFHHERYDGTGYPNGLKGDKIPEVARIIGVADAYDAMASNRSYRDALTQDVIREEIIKGKGKQFDPEVADIMVQLIDEDKNYEMRQSEHKDKKILIVDDQPVNIKLVKFALKNEKQYKIDGVLSGQEAIDTLKEKEYDMVLLDVKMPDMDGYETLKCIREFSDIPIVFMTADKELFEFEKGRELGAEDYVTKPFLPSVLIEILYSVLSIKK